MRYIEFTNTVQCIIKWKKCICGNEYFYKNIELRVENENTYYATKDRRHKFVCIKCGNITHTPWYVPVELQRLFG